MKILLIYPPLSRWNYTLDTMPLGLSSLAAYIMEKGHEVEILDAYAHKSTFEEIEKQIILFHPDIVGISSTTPLIKNAIRIAKISKEIDNQTLTVFGGIHPTAMPDEVLRSEYVDVVVRGEGEETFGELIEAYNRNKVDLSYVLGISYKLSGNIIHNPPRTPIQNLDLLPFPARELMPLSLYPRTIRGDPAGLMFTSRGCPNRCIFCDSHLIFGRKVRFRSPRSVLSEISYVIDQFNVTRIGFLDDTFTLNKDRVKEICEGIMKEHYDISLFCQARVNTVDRELLKIMKKAGFDLIDYGIESGNPEILRRIKKNISLDQARAALKITREVGINSSGDFIIGHPGETEETIKETINFAKEINPTFAWFNIMMPYPGTDLAIMLEKAGFKISDEYESFIQSPVIGDGGKLIYSVQNAMVFYNGLSSELIESYIRKAKHEFYFRPNKLIDIVNIIIKYRKEMLSKNILYIFKNVLF